jgi:hypothetical protein
VSPHGVHVVMLSCSSHFSRKAPLQDRFDMRLCGVSCTVLFQGRQWGGCRVVLVVPRWFRGS